MFPHPEWDPDPIEVPYKEDDDEEVKVKTIHKSPRDSFLKAFSKLVEAPRRAAYFELILNTKLLKKL